MEINIDLYSTLQNCARDTVNLIDDDEEFCEAEYELFKEWYEEKGYTDDDWLYVEACGYERDQFEKSEVINMWQEKAKLLQKTLQEFMDEIKFCYDEDKDEYSVDSQCFPDDFFGRDFLSTVDALWGDLEYFTSPSLPYGVGKWE